VSEYAKKVLVTGMALSLYHFIITTTTTSILGKKCW